MLVSQFVSVGFIVFFDEPAYGKVCAVAIITAVDILHALRAVLQAEFSDNLGRCHADLAGKSIDDTLGIGAESIGANGIRHKGYAASGGKYTHRRLPHRQFHVYRMDGIVEIAPCQDILCNVTALI